MDRVIDRLIDRLLDRVVALYPLREQRLELGLGDWDGPQLLYVCRGADVTGRWEPVIAPAPAPKVRLNRELLLVQPFPAGCSQQSLLCHPSIHLRRQPLKGKHLQVRNMKNLAIHRTIRLRARTEAFCKDDLKCVGRMLPIIHTDAPTHTRTHTHTQCTTPTTPMM